MGSTPLLRRASRRLAGAAVALALLARSGFA